jgi:uncharacterized protein (TIGR02594 family)
MPTPWFSVATHFKGITEVHGSVDNPKIVEMFRISGHSEIKDDETPWCAAFVGACLRLAGYRSSGSLGARSYQQFGEDLGDHPRRGCIVVFWRGNPKAGTGHVAFYDHDDGDHIVVLGGNQGDAVTSARYPKSRVLAYRWPTETAPLPTDTALPNILTIDPANAPTHLAHVGAAVPADEVAPTRAARAVEVLSEGSTGPEVRALQQELSARGFQVGPIDGEFGPLTRAAVVAFQTVQNLPTTGSGDEATLRALGIAHAVLPIIPKAAPIEIRAPQPSGGTGDMIMQPQDILKILLEALLSKQSAPAPTSAAGGSAAMNASQILQAVVSALAVKSAAEPSGAPAPVLQSGAPPVLSPIDTWLGGEALVGKKTALAILAYAVLAILQAVGVAGDATGANATPTGQILTTLIAAFGGLGGVAKIDRVVQLLGLMAAKPPTPPK